MYEIKKKDVVELKSLSAPPQLVIDILTATMILLGEAKPEDFKTAKRVFSKSDFLNRTSTFNADSVSMEAAVKARAFVDGVSAERVRMVNTPTVSFFQWVQDVLVEVEQRTGDLSKPAKPEPSS